MNARNNVAALLAAGMVATAPNLAAQTNATPAKTVDERIEALEKELQALKQQREQDRQAAEGSFIDKGLRPSSAVFLSFSLVRGVCRCYASLIFCAPLLP